MCIRNNRLSRLLAGFAQAFAFACLVIMATGTNQTAVAQTKVTAAKEQTEKHRANLQKVRVETSEQANGIWINGKFIENANEFAPIAQTEARSKRIVRDLAAENNTANLTAAAAAIPPRVFFSLTGPGTILAAQQDYADSPGADTLRVAKTGIPSVGPLGYMGGQLWAYSYGTAFHTFTMNTAGRVLFTDRRMVGGVNSPTVIGRNFYASVFSSNVPLYTANINSVGQFVLPNNPAPNAPGWISCLGASMDNKVLYAFNAENQSLYSFSLTTLNPQFVKVAQINRHISAISVMKDGRILLVAPIYYNGEENPPTPPSLLIVSPSNGATLALNLKGDVSLPEFTESLSGSSDGKFWVLPNNRYSGDEYFGNFSTGLLLLEDTNGDGVPDCIREWLTSDLAPNSPIGSAIFQQP